MSRFAERVVVVTGGSSGIGLALARRVASEGARVVLGARGRDAGEAAAREIGAAGGHAAFVAADVTDEAQAAGLVDAALERFGRLDGAFNNAGGVNGAGPVQDTATADWEADLAQNLTSVFYCMKAQIPAMLASPAGGSIVNNASLAGVAGIGGLPSYAAAKHGVVGLTKSAALACAATGCASTRSSPATSTRRSIAVCWAPRPGSRAPRWTPRTRPAGSRGRRRWRRSRPSS